jgi:hypothetical protein
MATRDKNQPPSQNKGKNLGQGLSGIKDQERRELAGSGDDAPTQDQRDDTRGSERSEDQSGTRH